MTDLQSTQALREAVVDLGRASDGDRVVRFFFELPLEEAWALLPTLRAKPIRLAAWHSPEDGSFVAGGVAWEAQVHGKKRFEQATAHWQDLEAARCDLSAAPGDEELPYCLSGFAFSENTSASTDWRGWGDGRLWVPEWLAARVGDRLRVVLNLPFAKGDSTEMLADRLIEKKQELERLAQAALTEGLGDPTGPGAEAFFQPGAETAWHRQVGQARNAFEHGRVSKVVLARAEQFACEAGVFDGIDTAFRMRAQQEGCTVFMVRRRGGQAFVGASPEELIRRKGRAISTMAMAGTRRRDEAEGPDQALGAELLKSQKDRHEQRLVTQAMTEALLPVVQELVLARVPEVAKLADVQHLRTRLRGTLRKDTDLFSLADALHPSPAVGGLPRAEALAWIADNENMDRGWYAGPIGWIRPGGDGLLVIAIRSVLMDAQRATAFVGCGLVENSDPASEWEESEAKLRPAVRGLAVRPRQEG
jgi:menaquinone-specific isochorismate synthase